jgi:hypothetical protein
MRSQYIIREYSNGAREVVDTIRFHRKIIYNNLNKNNQFADGDTVWFVNDKVVAVCPNGGTKKVYDELYAVLPLDHVVFPVIGREASEYHHKQTVMENLRQNPKHYDDHLSELMKCNKCEGVGCDKCKGEKPVINEAAVKNFFKLPKDFKLASKAEDIQGMKNAVKDMMKEREQ